MAKLNEKIKIKTNRPPNMSIGLLLLGFGVQHSASLLINESYIRSIVISVAQSLIFMASILKKIDDPQTPNQTVNTADPFSSIIPEASTVINEVIENDTENQIVLASQPIHIATPAIVSPENVIHI